MKTNATYFLLFLLLASWHITFAQKWDTFGNTGTIPGTNYLGTNDASDLDFRTNSNLWMRLTQAGFLGIGTVAPNTLLHLHQATAATPVDFQMTNATTTNGATNGFKIDVDNSSIVNLRQFETQPMRFHVFDQRLNVMARRGEWTGAEAMLENEVALHAVDGFRIWNPGYAASAAYDPLEAIDIWTGESATTHMRFDQSGLMQGINLRFEEFARLNGFWFDAAPLTSQAGFRGNYLFNMDSIEVVRFSNVNNTNRGFVRVGWQPGGAILDAARRLEVYDAADLPQFRITQSSTNATFTDFQTTTLGDLYINPETGGGNRYVGINLSTPKRTLDIFEPGGNGHPPQLRLTNTANANPALGIWTDFQTRNSGDLYIHPSNAGIDHQVGINTPQPGRTLEVYDPNAAQLRLARTGIPATVYTDFETTTAGNLYIQPTNSMVGINTATPGKSLEIKDGTTGNSGLRFTNLTSGYTPSVSSNGKVLTVNSTGDVILANETDRVTFCTTATAPAANFFNHIMKYTNTAGSAACNADMQEDDTYFNVGIGTYPHSNSKLYVNADVAPTSGIADLHGITILNDQHLAPGNCTNNVGVNIAVDGASSATIGLQIYPEGGAAANYGTLTLMNSNSSGVQDFGHWLGISSNSDNAAYGYTSIISAASQSINIGSFNQVNNSLYENIGVLSNVDNSLGSNDAIENYGVKTYVYGGQSHSRAFSGKVEWGSGDSCGADLDVAGSIFGLTYGVKAVADNGQYVNGVYGYTANGSNTTYGIFGDVSPGTSCIGGSFGCAKAAGYFNGDVYMPAAYILSDQKFKKNILDVSSTWQIINSLQPKTFDFDTASYPSMNLPAGNHYGLIAQDLEPILPNLIKHLIQPAV